MPRIQLVTQVHAPVERVFDLSRSIDLHADGAAHTEERAVGGVTSGLIGLHGEVTWEAKHFGVRQRLTSRITAFARPRHFRDSMVRGAFRRFDHDHFFEREADGLTKMTDVFDFDSPFGIFGRLANRLFLTRYMEKFLAARNWIIKTAAETDQWRQYLPDARP
jgi:hypothetical protein